MYQNMLHRQFAPGVKNKDVGWIYYWCHVYDIHIPRHRNIDVNTVTITYIFPRNIKIGYIDVNENSRRVSFLRRRRLDIFTLVTFIICISQSALYTPVLSYLADLYIKRTVVVLSAKILVLKPNSLCSVVIVYLLLKYKIVSKKITREIINCISTFI